ncbi:adenosylcobinamide-GDP ribazoletransferase [Nocardioides sp. CN2-186]|uniref:adenosylcobinamide-GDP ribazoletransferase n=1 Tax=Nocardioides tweenelious TaxID=3156607 RepID=UPI0032B4DF5C
MLLDAWRLAVGTLTALPVRPPSIVDPARARLAMVLAPVAALPLGAAAAAVVVAGDALDLAPLVVALLAIGAVTLGNRGFHLDGLSDTVDALAASYDRERSLAVMKSGTSGPAGGVAVLLVVGLQVAGLAGTSSAPAVGAAVCLSRAALVVCCLRSVPPARTDGIGRSFTQTVPVTVAIVVWLVVTVLLTLVGGWHGTVASVCALLVVAILVWRAVRRFGGVTGDVFGASIELALAAMLVALS